MLRKSVCFSLQSSRHNYDLFHVLEKKQVIVCTCRQYQYMHVQSTEPIGRDFRRILV